MIKRIARIHLSSYIFAAVIAVFVGLAIYVTIMPHARADDASVAEGEHIVTVHDDGEDIGFITKAVTLREALENAGISVDQNDRTEPSLDTELVANSYQVNIYRARAVVVKDGAAETKVITSYRTGQQIAEQAGITTHDEDELDLSQSIDPMADGVAEVLTIKRATEFNFDFYGKNSTSYSQAKTVGAMLDAKGIKMADNDVVVPARDTPLTSGMNVRLYRNGTQTVTLEEEIPFETEQIKDANREKGYQEIQTAGVNGKRTVTYEVKIENGVEVSRSEVNSNTTQEPVKQVEIVGTKVSLPSGSHEDWMAAAGISESDYGYVNYIFTRESGWSTTASNGTYYGLGQTNLAKLSDACPNWESDPICQIRLFNSYAVERYGSWAAAYEFWISSHWW